jgi:hypothetical protein
MDDSRETSSHPDRREARRFDTRLPVDVDGRKARLTDLSQTGVGFVTDEPPPTGSTVKIGVRHLPDDRHPAPSEAEVVRVNEEPDGSFNVGARLNPTGKG